MHDPSPPGAYANAMERKQWANRLCGQESTTGAAPLLEKQPSQWLGQRPAIVIDDPEHLTQDISEIEVRLTLTLT